MSFSLSDIKVMTLPQLTGGQDWRLLLAQDRPHHLLIWITRGQGRALLDGQRRGVGTHNALWVPQGSLFALDLGRQGMAQAVIVPPGTPLRLPEMPRHLRIRDVAVQSELSGLIEAAAREQQKDRPLSQDAAEAHAALISVWLRRQIMLEEHVPPRRNAAARLSKLFCDQLPQRFRSGASMAEYAATLGVTATHLTRAVKAATGKTAADLLTERVLAEARKLLIETRQPAQDIARHLGFGSAAYFTRFMQQHTGQPPSKLRGAAR
jgi:AraC family transcriptional activator of pobA